MLENLVTSLITYGEDSLKVDSKMETLELQEQFCSNLKFRKVLTLVFELFELFLIKPSFMERMNFLMGFREFVIEKYLEWRQSGVKLHQLDGMRRDQRASTDVDKEKMLWVDLVRLYNILSLKVDQFHVLLQKTNCFIEKYLEIRELFKDEYLVEVVKITSRFLFCQKMFKECTELLAKVLHERQQPWPEAYSTFEKLKDACLRASAENQAILEVEDIRNTKPTKPNKKKPFDTEDVVLETEAKVLTQTDVAEKMELFSKLALQEQIDKAETYLLSYLQTQRTPRSPQKTRTSSSPPSSTKS